MRLALVYDLRDDYLALGYSPEATAEFDSQATIDALDQALRRLGWDVARIGRGQELARQLAVGERFDLVFSIAEGLAGRCREAQVAALCELFDQPYVFSDPMTMAVTLDKPVAKRLVRDHGIPTAAFAVVADPAGAARGCPLPGFVKPAAEGTGKGCAAASRVTTQDELDRQVAHVIATYHQPALVEAYLPGREFTVGIVGHGASAQIVAVMELRVHADADGGVYSYEIKEHWEPYVTMQVMDDPEARLAGAHALAAYRALDCRDAARIDMRSDAEGRPHFLEANPLAGLHPTHSDLPILTTKAGHGYDWLIARIVASACQRHGMAVPAEHGEHGLHAA